MYGAIHRDLTIAARDSETSCAIHLQQFVRPKNGAMPLGARLKPLEIIWILSLVVVSLLISNILTGSMALHGAFHRLIVRAFFQVILLALLYLFYESRNNSKRLSEIETQINSTVNGTIPERVERKKPMVEIVKGDSDG